MYFDTDFKLDVRKRISRAVRQRVKNNLATACTICRKPIEDKLVPLTPISSSISTKQKPTVDLRFLSLSAEKRAGSNPVPGTGGHDSPGHDAADHERPEHEHPDHEHGHD